MNGAWWSAGIKEARFPTVKSLDSFDFAAIPSLNNPSCWSSPARISSTRQNTSRSNSGTGKTDTSGLGLGLAACQKGLSIRFYTAAALVHELLEARDEKRLLRLQRQLAGYKLLIIDELGYVPLSRPAPSCCLRCSASDTSAVQLSSPRTCRSTNGPACSVRAAHRRAARPANPSCPYPANERRQLQAQSEQAPLAPSQFGHAAKCIPPKPDA